MNRDDPAEKQKQKAKEMLGISDDRANEIFTEQPDRKQQKKQEIEEKKRQVESKAEEAEEKELKEKAQEMEEE